MKQSTSMGKPWKMTDHQEEERSLVLASHWDDAAEPGGALRGHRPLPRLLPWSAREPGPTPCRTRGVGAGLTPRAQRAAPSRAGENAPRATRGPAAARAVGRELAARQSVLRGDRRPEASGKHPGVSRVSRPLGALSKSKAVRHLSLLPLKESATISSRRFPSYFSHVYPSF